MFFLHSDQFKSKSSLKLIKKYIFSKGEQFPLKLTGFSFCSSQHVPEYDYSIRMPESKFNAVIRAGPPVYANTDLSDALAPKADPVMSVM